MPELQAAGRPVHLGRRDARAHAGPPPAAGQPGCVRRRPDAPPRNNGRTCTATPSSWPASSDGTAGVRGGPRGPASVRDRYGRHPLGQNLLLARRLVEAGVGFVTVNGWTGKAPDEKLRRPARLELGHARQQHGHGQRLRHRLLRHGLVLAAPGRGAVGAADRSARARPAGTHAGGVHGRVRPHAATSSTGSTPAVSTGRSASPRSWPAAASAAAQVYGESDKIGAYVKDRPVRPQDLGATIYHALGVPLDPRLGKDGVSPAADDGDAAGGVVRVGGAASWGPFLPARATTPMITGCHPAQSPVTP